VETKEKSLRTEEDPAKGAVVSGKQPTVFWKRDMNPAVTADAAASEATPRPLQPTTLTAPIAGPSRGEMLTGLSTIAPGASRADVLKKLGKPVYTIAMPDNGYYVERSKFRSGGETIATIEFRDGVVASIDKAAP
jgi:hypothetical protein